MPNPKKKPKAVLRNMVAVKYSNLILDAVTMACYGKSVQAWRDKYGNKILSDVIEDLCLELIQIARGEHDLAPVKRRKKKV